MSGALGQRLRRWLVSEEPPTDREHLGFLALAGTVALICLIIAFIGKFGSIQDIPANFGGAASYVDFATNWVLGRGPLDNGRPPGYPLLLAAGALAMGEQALPYYAAAVQSLLLLATVFAAFFLGCRITGRPAWGFVASTAVAANLSFGLECLAARETCLYAALLVLMLAVIAGKEITTAKAIILGLLASAVWLTRPTGFIPVAAGGLILLLPTSTENWRRRLRLVCLYAVGLVCPIAIWMGYQAATQDSVHISGKSAVRTFYYSWHPALDTIYPVIDVDELDPYVDAQEAEWIAEGKDPRVMYRQEGIRFALSSPLRSAKLVFWKFVAFFVPIQFPMADGTPIYANGTWSIENEQSLSPIQLILGITAGFGVLGFFLTLADWRDWPAWVAFIMVIVVLTALLHLMTFAETRYRQPFDPMLAVLGVWQIHKRISGWISTEDQA